MSEFLFVRFNLSQCFATFSKPYFYFASQVKDAEHSLASKKKYLSKLEVQFQELKSSGGGQAELNRDNIKK